MNNSSDPFATAKELLENETQVYRDLIKSTRRKLSVGKIHKLRIQIQKLLAALELATALSGAPVAFKLVRQLKRTKRRTSLIRDLQVELAFLKKSSAKNLDGFKSHLQSRHDKLEKKILRKLADISLRKQAKQIEKTGRVLIAPTKAEFRSAVDERIANYVDLASKSLERHLRVEDSGKAKDLHHFRVKAKKLRYLAEAQKAVFGHTKVDISGLKKVQSVLGRVQNDTALIEHVDKYLARSGNNEDNGAKTLLGEIKADQTKLLKSATKVLATEHFK